MPLIQVQTPAILGILAQRVPTSGRNSQDVDNELSTNQHRVFLVSGAIRY